MTTRIIGSGSGAVPPLATVTAITFTRNATECLSHAMFMVDAVPGAAFDNNFSGIIGDSITAWIERTSNPDECTLRLRNNNPLATRTAEWQVIGTIV